MAKNVLRYISWTILNETWINCTCIRNSETIKLLCNKPLLHLVQCVLLLTSYSEWQAGLKCWSWTADVCCCISYLCWWECQCAGGNWVLLKGYFYPVIFQHLLRWVRRIRLPQPNKLLQARNRVRATLAYKGHGIKLIHHISWTSFHTQSNDNCCKMGVRGQNVKRAIK